MVLEVPVWSFGRFRFRGSDVLWVGFQDWFRRSGDFGAGSGGSCVVVLEGSVVSSRMLIGVLWLLPLFLTAYHLYIPLLLGILEK